jgi:phospholipid/cholesterol/gamma-HCH transport system permease protein
MQKLIIKKINDVCNQVGSMIILFFEIIYWAFKRKLDFSNIIYQCQESGVKSFPVILLTSFSTGMVLALQMGLVMQRWLGYPMFVGMTVGFSEVKELGPILTAIVIAGRVGAAITAELGTMKVTEQIDALYTLGSHPTHYLAVPRFISCLLMVPALTLLSMVISVIGGLFISVTILNIPSSVYFSDIFDYMYINDFLHGFIKAIIFGIIIAWVSIYKGFNCEGGAEGVGKATTDSVVLSMILIIVSDYFLSSILISLGIGSGDSFATRIYK